MTVRELIDELQKVESERIVILQKDAEGNAYSPISGIDYEGLTYVADNTWSGEVLDDHSSGGIPCVVVFPIN